MSGELCELRDRDLYFSLAESSELLANFGVEMAGAEVRTDRGRTWLPARVFACRGTAAGLVDLADGW
jgi:hypothetical protein